MGVPKVFQNKIPTQNYKKNSKVQKLMLNKKPELFPGFLELKELPRNSVIDYLNMAISV